MDCCWGFVIFAIIMTVITLLGHGIWVVLATIFRTPQSPPPPSDAARRCPSCGALVMDRQARCPGCNLAMGGSVESELRDLKQARHVLMWLQERGDLDDETATKVLACLRLRRDVLLGEAAPPAPKPQPAVAPRPVETVNVPPLPMFQAVPIPEVLPVAATAAPPPPPAPVIPKHAPVPAPPRRRLGDVLASFMEDRNILWGELVGGLLIVGCSIALIISLWGQLVQLPYFPFFLFGVLTAALFGAGEYTLHHWKLTSTSRGLLLISLLLIPLSLLVFSGPGGRGEADLGPVADWAVAGIGVCLAAFATRAAGRDLIGIHTLPGPLDRRFLLILAVVGVAAVQMFAPESLEDPTDVARWSWPSLVAYVLACGAVLAGLTGYGTRLREPMSKEQSHALFAFLGTSTFAMAAVFGSLLLRLDDPLAGSIALAVPLVAFAIPALGSGLSLWRGLEATPHQGERTGGIAVAVAGSVVMLVGVVLAWPAPLPLLGALSLAGIVLVLAAIAARTPWTHAIGLPCLLFALVLGVHLLDGTLPLDVESASAVLPDLLTAVPSTIILVSAALSITLLAAALTWEDHARVLAWVGLITAALAVVVVTAQASEFPLHAALVHAVAVLSAVVVFLRWELRPIAYLGGAVWLVGGLWALQGWYPSDQTRWSAFIGVEAVAFACIALAFPQRTFGPICGHLALWAGAMGTGLALVSGAFPTQPEHTIAVLCLAVTVLTQAITDRRAEWFVGFQLLLAGAVVCGLTAAVAEAEWLQTSLLGFLDPRVWQVYGIGLAALCFVSQLLGGRLRQNPVIRDLWPSGSSCFENATLGMVTIVHLVVVVIACLIGLGAVWSGSEISADLQARQEALGVVGWLLSAALVPGLIMALYQRRDREQSLAAIAGLWLTLFTVGILTADLYRAEVALEPALRWSLALCFMGGSALVWARQRLTRWTRLDVPAVGLSNGLLDVVAGWVMVLTFVLANLGFQGQRVPQPDAESVFAQMGTVLAGIGPMALLVLGFAGCALRERSPGHALAGGLLATVSVAGGYALGIVTSGAVLGDIEVVRIVLLLCVTPAIGSLLWLAGRERVGAGAPLALLSWLGLAGLALAAILPGVAFFFEPNLGHDELPGLGGWETWVTLALTLAAAGWHAWRLAPVALPHWVGLGCGLFAVAAACTVHPLCDPEDWVPYHTMAILFTTQAVLAAGLTYRPRTQPLSRAAQGWLIGLVVVLGFHALRGNWDWAPTPQLSAFAGGAVLAALAWRTRLAGFAYASGSLLTLGFFASGMFEWAHLPMASEWWSVIALALAGAIWFAQERWRPRAIDWPWPSFALLACGVALCLLLTWSATGLDELLVGSSDGLSWMGGVALVAVGLCVGLAQHSRLGPPMLYLFGFCVSSCVLQALRVQRADLVWSLPLCVAGQTLLASLLLWAVTRGQPIGASGCAERTEREWGWLCPVQVVVSLFALVAAVMLSVAEISIERRLVAPLITAVVACGLGLLAAIGPRTARTWLSELVAGLTLTVAVLGMCAWVNPTGPAPWLQRTAWTLPMVVAATWLALEPLRRLPGASLSSKLLWLAIALVPTFLLQLLLEYDKVARQTPLDTLAVLASGLALVGLVVLCVRLALVGERLLGWSEAARMGCVYAAEVLLVCVFIDIRLNAPWMFSGRLVHYWTLFVMALAFAGVGLSEWFDRRQLRVLAVPLQRTGIFLPLVPLLAFWVRPPSVLLAFADEQAPGMRPLLGYFELLPWDFDKHALIWVMTGGLYALLATWRQSYRWALAAALATNFALWAIFMHLGVAFLTHPQAWLIPLALILLVSEYLNRDHLSPAMAEALRYLGATLIYTASTADLLLVGLGNSVWLPIVLAVLAVLGVLGGIMLRVRAFLFLGVGFLLVDLLCMIWHAAVNRQQAWLWWASGIVLGAAILALFALFEKRRNDVLQLVDELRRWD